MQQLPILKRLAIRYWGRVFAFAFFSRRRRFLGVSQSGWIRFLTTVLFLGALVMRLGTAAVLLTLALAVWVRFIYWQAQRLGYSRFVPDKTAVMPDGEIVPLPTDDRLALRATGRFALNTHEETVLLRPAEYWRAPSGDHIVMVEHRPQAYLYQFFTGTTLQAVQPGWLVFGREPRQTLAVTFLESWGPSHNNNALRYFVGGGEVSNSNLKTRQIYLSFEDEASLEAVWRTLVWQARQARQSIG